MLTYNSLLTNGVDYPPSPKRDDQHRKRQESNNSMISINDPNTKLSTTDPDSACDCDSYQINNMACPCSARHAARMGRRATERILHRSPFFQSRDLSSFCPVSKSKIGNDQSSRFLLESSVREIADDEKSDVLGSGIEAIDSP